VNLVSWNVNGLRSVTRKGFLEWFKKTDPDILCLQEIKIQKDKLTPELLKPKGYFSSFNFAKKRGYSGVLVYSKEKPISVKKRLGIQRFDEEGRILELKFRRFTLINLYLPHGGRQKENLVYKLQVYQKLLRRLKKIKSEKMILMGDFNIAHEEIDLERPKANRNNIMFTSEERQQIDNLMSLGYVDTFRQLHKEGGNYTWWPYMRNARQRNLGWRIDYGFVSKPFLRSLIGAYILPFVMGSDHCPIGIRVASLMVKKTF
jgi:exodeoxyribonuclease III